MKILGFDIMRIRAAIFVDSTHSYTKKEKVQPSIVITQPEPARFRFPATSKENTVGARSSTDVLEKKLEHLDVNAHDSLQETRPAAWDAVLQTTELLELILLALPLKDLLFAQRVCRSWKETIDGSPKLQKALFFQPATNLPVFFRDDAASQLSRAADDDAISFRPGASLWTIPDNYGVNYYFFCPPDLIRQTVRKRAAVEPEIVLPDGLIGPFQKTRVFMNPLLDACLPLYNELFHAESTWAAERRKWITADPPREAAYRPEASWRRMLLTQPPLGGLTAAVHQWRPSALSADSVRFALLFGFEGEPITMQSLERGMIWHAGKHVLLKGLEELELWEAGTDLEKIQSALIS